jgi:lipid II isoglutaminyl synthase (glutamine-hydrolysing)
MAISDNLAVIAGKLSARAIRAVGAGLGSNLPGRIARRVSPHILKHLSAQGRRGVIAVSGTNGKSTTSGFIHSILTRAGLKTVHNRQGANLVTGITATLIDAADWKGKVDADYYLFEVDEASLPVVALEMEFSAVLVTNLFRDQLDRFGELDTTARLIEKGIACKQSRAVLNADDPNVAQLASGSQRIFYGIGSVKTLSAHAGTAVEFSYCAKCGSQYEYDLILYGQLGHYRCPACGFTRPQPLVCAEDVQVDDASSNFVLKLPGESHNVKLNLPGLFNVYNAVAAAALTHSLGVSGLTIEDGLSHYTTLFGRSEKLNVDGKPVIIQLIKNPAGASQVVATVSRNSNARILIAINDNLADGRDISWLWDSDFELLSAHRRTVIISGQRAEDMAVRMKYAGIPVTQIEVVAPLERALRQSLAALQPEETLWILPTYTCLLELQKIFKSMGHVLSGTN